MSSSFNTNQVTVNSTATLIVAENTGRKAVVVTNLGTVAVYIGPNANVSTSTGELLPGTVGASISIPSTSAVWGISSGSAQAVSFLDA